MRKLFLLVFIALPAAVLPQQAEQNAPRGSIPGVVRNPATGEGIPEVEVQLREPAGGGQTVTDSAGTFQFTNLPPVMVVLEPAAAISGRLLDPQGKPLAGIAVAALRVGYRDGGMVLQPVGTTRTDDRGNFRLSELLGGRYYVLAEVPSPGGVVSTDSLPQATYYPGTIDWARAIAIEIPNGTEISGVDFAMMYAQGFTISGSVAIRVPGNLSANGQLVRTVSGAYVIPKNPPPGERRRLIPNTIPPQSSDSSHFELHGIPPGSYHIFPLVPAPALPNRNLTAGFFSYSVRIPVDVVDRDVTGLTGEIRTYPDLSFRVLMGPGVTPLTSRPGLQRLDNLSFLAMYHTQTEDGTMVFSNVFPSRYRILLQLNGGDDYIADIRQGGASLYNDAVVTTHAGENTPVEILVNSGGGKIRGTLRKNGHPAAARVVLIPEPPRRGNSSLYYQDDVTGASGEFLLQGIAPGEYKLFAWENLPVGAEQVPEIIREYETKGRPVSIRQGSEIGDITLDVLMDKRR